MNYIFYSQVLTVYNDKSIMQNDKRICHFNNESCQKSNKFSYELFFIWRGFIWTVFIWIYNVKSIFYT